MYILLQADETHVLQRAGEVNATISSVAAVECFHAARAHSRLDTELLSSAHNVARSRDAICGRSIAVK